MATNTTNLKIPKPEGNEYFNRESFNHILDVIDQNTASKDDIKESKEPKLSLYKSGKENGKYTILEWKRKDDTLYRKSVLSDFNGEHYLKQTVTLYGENGTTVLETDVYTLTYDEEGNNDSEVIQ